MPPRGINARRALSRHSEVLLLLTDPHARAMKGPEMSEIIPTTNKTTVIYDNLWFYVIVSIISDIWES